MADIKSTTPDAGPNFEVLERVKNIPVVSVAIEKTGKTYTYLKGSHHLINWALDYAEAGYALASTTAAPLAKKFEGQINTVDQKLCEGLNIVEQKVPIMKQPPQEIYDAAKKVMSSSLQPTVEKLVAVKENATNQATLLKEISVTKANEILDNQYGTIAVQGVDNTTAIINSLIDHYFPPIEGEEIQPVPVSADENKVLHAVQTIGQLSTKTANRIYHSVSAQLKTVKREDVADYISSVISILHLTHFIGGEKENTTPTTSSSSSSFENNK